MTGKGPLFQVAVDKDPDAAFQTAANTGFLDAEQGQIGGPARAAQGRGGIQGVQVRRDGEDQRDDVPFFQPVIPQQFIIEGGRLKEDILILV
jgi:hypothetical protein